MKRIFDVTLYEKKVDDIFDFETATFAVVAASAESAIKAARVAYVREHPNRYCAVRVRSVVERNESNVLVRT